MQPSCSSSTATAAAAAVNRNTVTQDGIDDTAIVATEPHPAITVTADTTASVQVALLKDALRSSFSCGRCDNLLQGQPRTSRLRSCLHNFCADCCSNTSTTTSSQEGAFVCPICETPHELPQDLFPNRAMEDVLAAYQELGVLLRELPASSSFSSS